MVLERVDLVQLCCGVILGFSLGMLATSGMLPTTGLGSASPSERTSADDWSNAWAGGCFFWAPLMQQIATALGGWLSSSLWALIFHVGSSLPSFLDVIPWALVAVVSCSPDGTFVEGAVEVPFLVILALQGLVFVWAVKKILAVADAADARRGRKSQRLRGKLRRMTKKALALKSRTIKDIGAQSNELGKSPPRPRTATATEQKAKKDEFSEMESTGSRIDDDEGQQRVESPTVGSLQGSQSAGVEAEAPSEEAFDEFEDCQRELDKTLAMVDAAMASKEVETQERHRNEMERKSATWAGLLDAKKAEMQALRRTSEAASTQHKDEMSDYLRELGKTLAAVDAATAATKAEMVNEHEAEMANAHAACDALVGALEAEVQALREEAEAASAAIFDLDKTAMRELERAVGAMSEEARAREAKTQERHANEMDAKNLEWAGHLDAQKADYKSEREVGAAREGLEVAEAELSETRALLELERAGSATKLAEIARLEAEVARLLDLGILPGSKEEASAMDSPSGSSATSIVSPCSSVSPAIGGSCFSTSSSSDGSNKRGGGRKTKGEKKQASKLAAKRTRMPAGAPAVKSAQG